MRRDDGTVRIVLGRDRNVPSHAVESVDPAEVIITNSSSQIVSDLMALTEQETMTVRDTTIGPNTDTTQPTSTNVGTVDTDCTFFCMTTGLVDPMGGVSTSGHAHGDDDWAEVIVAAGACLTPAVVADETREEVAEDVRFEQEELDDDSDGEDAEDPQVAGEEKEGGGHVQLQDLQGPVLLQEA